MRPPTLVETIRKNGHKLTRLRLLLLRYFSEHNLPVSAAELLQFAETKKVLVNKTSIYRELEFLMSQRVIKEVHFGDRTSRFELYENEDEDHHHHLICTHCRGIQGVGCTDQLKRHEQKVYQQHQFAVTRHLLEFFGICRECQKKGAKL